MWGRKDKTTAVFIVLLSLVRQCDPKIAEYNVANGFSRPDPPLVIQVISALDKIIRYYEGNYLQLNLDGIFGAKAIEGQLNLVVAKHNKGLLRDDIDYIMKNELAQMATRAGRVVRLALPNLYKRQPVSMHRLHRLFQLSWDMGHSHRKVDLTLLWDSATKAKAPVKSITESDSDRCMGEVLQPSNGVMCVMSSWCQELMTFPGHSSYPLTRQILYSIVAEMSGCGSRLEQWLIKHKRTGSLEQLQAEMCANLYPEACLLPHLSHTHTNPATVWDLFMQMEFVCGMLGYSQFLQESWLMDILARQDSIGCYKDIAHPNHTHIGAQDSITTAASTTYTQLLSEIMLKDGCLAHLTGIAGSSLAVHLHSLLYDQSVPPSSASRPRPPAQYLQPPDEGYPPLAPGVGIMVNKPLFRGEVHSGLNRIAEQEKTLEDKADVLMQKLEEEKEEEERKRTVEGEEEVREGGGDGKEEEWREKEHGGKVETGERNGRENTNHGDNIKHGTIEGKPDSGNSAKKPHRRHYDLELPYMAVPLTLPSASVPPSPSPTPLWLATIGVVVVIVGLLKYAQTHTRRRRCTLKGKFWL